MKVVQTPNPGSGEKFPLVEMFSVCANPEAQLHKDLRCTARFVYFSAVCLLFVSCLFTFYHLFIVITLLFVYIVYYLLFATSYQLFVYILLAVNFDSEF